MAKIYSPLDYKDILVHITLASDEIRRRISTYHLEFYNIYNHTVEWNMQLPMFARSFYGYVFKMNDIPTQQQFFEYYISVNSLHLDNNTMSGLKARAYRTYPSLVRDICFNKYVQEHISGFTALYSLELDINEGIDLMLSNGSNHYAVNLYIDTRRAYFGREKKQYRHTPFRNVHYIEFPVVFENSHKVGDFSYMVKKSIII